MHDHTIKEMPAMHDPSKKQVIVVENYWRWLALISYPAHSNSFDFNSVMLSKTVDFGHGMTAELRIVNPDDRDDKPFVEVVLFDQGREVDGTPPNDEIAGEYHLYDHEGEGYIVEVKSTGDQ